MSEPQQRERLSPAAIVLLAFCAAALLALVVLCVIWLPSLAQMFADFGGTLPWLTRLIMARSWTVGCTLLILASALGGALAPRPRVRLALLIAALTLAVLAVASTLIGAYLPVFQLTDAIHAP